MLRNNNICSSVKWKYIINIVTGCNICVYTLWNRETRGLSFLMIYFHTVLFIWGQNTPPSCGNWFICSFQSSKESTDCPLSPLPHAPSATTTWRRIWIMLSSRVTSTMELENNSHKFSPSICLKCLWRRFWDWNLENFQKRWNFLLSGLLLLSFWLFGRGDLDREESAAMKSELKLKG